MTLHLNKSTVMIGLVVLAVASCGVVLGFWVSENDPKINLPDKSQMQVAENKLGAETIQSAEDGQTKKGETVLFVEDILKEPEKYDGKRLTIRGYYYTAYGYGDGLIHRVIVPEIVRDEAGEISGATLHNAIEINWYDQEILHSNFTQGSKEKNEFFGQVEVEGIFDIVTVSQETIDKNRAMGMTRYIPQNAYTYHDFGLEKISVYDETTNQYVPIAMKRRR